MFRRRVEKVVLARCKCRCGYRYIYQAGNFDIKKIDPEVRQREREGDREVRDGEALLERFSAIGYLSL